MALLELTALVLGVALMVTFGIALGWELDDQLKVAEIT